MWPLLILPRMEFSFYLSRLPTLHKVDIPVAQMLKSLAAVQETWVRSLGQEGALEKGMATQSSILAWEIP